jgi:hypothetical protein
MARVASHVVIAVPAELCQEVVQAALGNGQLHDAARRLRPGKEYSGRVTAVKTGRWLEIAFAALDPVSGRRFHALGWRVTYDLLPLDDGRTRVEVAIEYGLLAALGAMGSLRAQAENDIMHRLTAMHALEFGLHRGRAPELRAAHPPHDGDAYPAHPRARETAAEAAAEPPVRGVRGVGTR